MVMTTTEMKNMGTTKYLKPSRQPKSQVLKGPFQLGTLDNKITNDFLQFFPPPVIVF